MPRQECSGIVLETIIPGALNAEYGLCIRVPALALGGPTRKAPGRKDNGRGACPDSEKTGKEQHD